MSTGNKSGNLLSRKASANLNIVQFVGNIQENDIFGFGKWYTEPVKLHLDSNHRPYAIYAARKVPIPLLPKVKEALESMEKQGVIEKVSKPTAWVSPMVPVAKAKSDKVRITVDYKKLNQHLQRETYPIPNFETLAAKLNGATRFSKLDAASGFY